MPLHPRLTRDTVALVKRFETFQPQAEPSPQGGWSIGYGHTLSAREGGRVDRADAEALLIFDLDRSARAVEHALFAPVTQRQFEALTALCFNLGEPAFLRSSALARTNAGAELDAADEIERWRQAELGAGMQVVDALVRRRAAEKAHFLGLPEGGSTWPSALLRALPAAGGDTSDPMAEALECPPSAALTAADGVQARLRRLFPEDATRADAAPPSEPAFLAFTESVASRAPITPSETAVLSPLAPPLAEPGRDRAPAPPRHDADIAWEPIPPPFDPPASSETHLLAAGLASPTLQPAAADADDVVRENLDGEADRAETAEAPRAPPRDGRWASVLLTLVGATLFVGAAVLILTGRPSLLDLGLGIAGVVVAVPGLYGLLGVSRSAGGARWDDKSAAPPFHTPSAHTK